MVDVSPKPDVPPAYLGDGVYARFDGFQIWVEASNGVQVTAAVALDPGVWTALLAWEKRMAEAQRAQFGRAWNG